MDNRPWEYQGHVKLYAGFVTEANLNIVDYFSLYYRCLIHFSLTVEVKKYPKYNFHISS